MTRIIGLTGGIASGKSTVTSFLRQQGYPVIDADAVVHQLQAKGGHLYQVLVSEFGPSILDTEGQLDRGKLGQQVFGDAQLRQKVAGLQDGIIREALVTERDRLKGTTSLLFMDIPLLYEAGYETEVDEVWLVYVGPQTQLERLVQRNGYSLAHAQQRIAAQAPLAEKRAKATHVINNGGSKEATFEQVLALLKESS